MSKKTIVFLLIGIALIFSFVYLMSRHDTIIFNIFEGTDTDYNKFLFKNCNPCPLTIVVKNEDQLFDNVIFRFDVEWLDVIGTKVGCVEIEDKTQHITGVGDRQEWELAKSQRSLFCQSNGYKDKCGSCQSEWCYQTPKCRNLGGRNCIGSSINCINDEIKETKWIEVRYGREIITKIEKHTDKKASITKDLEVDLAKYINQECGNHIITRQLNPNYDYECKVDFKVYSENNAGSWKITDEPTNIGRITPTTTTTIQHYVCGDLKCEFPEDSSNCPEDCGEKYLYLLGILIILVIIMIWKRKEIMKMLK